MKTYAQTLQEVPTTNLTERAKNIERANEKAKTTILIIIKKYR